MGRDRVVGQQLEQNANNEEQKALQEGKASGEHAAWEKLTLSSKRCVINGNFDKTQIVKGLSHYSFAGEILTNYQQIHIVRFEQGVNPDLALVPSKASAALVPGTSDRSVHHGDEATFQQILEKQVGVRMMVNGVFHHYSKTLYNPSCYSVDFRKGDNVHLASYYGFRIGESMAMDSPAYRYAYITQSKPGYPFQLQSSSELLKEKGIPFYTVTGSPMLIWDSAICEPSDILLEHEFAPQSIPAGTITPPGNLSHLHRPNPRTIIATTPKNDILFITVDGLPKNTSKGGQEQGLCYGKGMTAMELVTFLSNLKHQDKDLEIRHAANMDGGGSTTLYLHDNEKGEIKNQPSDPGRAIGNTLIIFDHFLFVKENNDIKPEHCQQFSKAYAKHREGFHEFYGS